MIIISESYLGDFSKDFGYNPDDGQPHAGEQRQFPRLAHHEVHEESEARRVPHHEAELLAQSLAHLVGTLGNVGHQFTWGEKFCL